MKTQSWRITKMNDENGISSERMNYLKLFKKISDEEFKNSHSKEFPDREMQNRIKKIIQTMVVVVNKK